MTSSRRCRQGLGGIVGLALFGQGCVAAHTVLPQPEANHSLPIVAVAQAPEGAEEDAGVEAYYRFMRSLLAEQKGDHQGAIKWQKDALQFDPRSVAMQTHLASLYVKRGDFRNAINAGENALTLDPKSLPAHLILASAYQSLHNLPAAERYFRRAIELNPARIDTYLQLASLYVGTKKMPEAIAVYRQALDVDPGWQEISWQEAMDAIVANLERIRDNPKKLWIQAWDVVGDGAFWLPSFGSAFGSCHVLVASSPTCGKCSRKPLAF